MSGSPATGSCSQPPPGPVGATTATPPGTRTKAAALTPSSLILHTSPVTVPTQISCPPFVCGSCASESPVAGHQRTKFAPEGYTKTQRGLNRAFAALTARTTSALTPYTL